MFTISHEFVQTALLIVYCCITGTAIVWLIYLLRWKRTNRKIQAELKQRTKEREVEAQKLQDTLLQNTQGLILRFHAIAEQLRDGDEARKKIEDALDRADEVLADEREKVASLNMPAEAVNNLPKAFAVAGAELVAGTPVSFQVLVEGSPRDLNPTVRDQVYAVGREALANAICHARAGSIEAHVIYTDEELLIRVRDDGRGVDSHVLEEGAHSGRSGLASMRARAQALGAQLYIWSRAGAGTEVELRVPAAVAYSRQTN